MRAVKPGEFLSVGQRLLRARCVEDYGGLVAYPELKQARFAFMQGDEGWEAALIFRLNEIMAVDCDENQSVRRGLFHLAALVFLAQCRQGNERVVAAHFFERWERYYAEDLIAERSGLIEILFAEQIRDLFDGDVEVAKRTIYSLFSRVRRAEAKDANAGIAELVQHGPVPCRFVGTIEVDTPGGGKTLRPFLIRFSPYVSLAFAICHEERPPYKERGQLLVDLRVVETRLHVIPHLVRLGLYPTREGTPPSRLDRTASRLCGLLL